MKGDVFRIDDDLAVQDERRSEVDENVGDEDDVDDHVDGGERVAVDRRRTGRVRRDVAGTGGERETRSCLLAEHECGHVRREDGRVEDEEKGDPVPDSLEGRVV